MLQAGEHGLTQINGRLIVAANQINPRTEDVEGQLSLDPAVRDGVGDESKDAGISLVPEVEPAAAPL